MGVWSFGTSIHGLGLPEDVLWRLSPRQYVALADRWRDAERKGDWRVAHMMSLMANIWKGKDVKPFTTEDFMPKVKEEDPAAEQQPWQQQLAIVQALHAAFKSRQQQLKAG